MLEKKKKTGRHLQGSKLFGKQKVFKMYVSFIERISPKFLRKRELGNRA